MLFLVTGLHCWERSEENGQTGLSCNSNNHSFLPKFAEKYVMLNLEADCLQQQKTTGCNLLLSNKNRNLRLYFKCNLISAAIFGL